MPSVQTIYAEIVFLQGGELVVMGHRLEGGANIQRMSLGVAKDTVVAHGVRVGSEGGNSPSNGR